MNNSACPIIAESNHSVAENTTKGSGPGKEASFERLRPLKGSIPGQEGSPFSYEDPRKGSGPREVLSVAPSFPALLHGY